MIIQEGQGKYVVNVGGLFQCLYRIGLYPSSKLIFVHAAISDCMDSNYRIGLRRLQLIAVDKQKHSDRNQCDTFVSVWKAVIPGESIAIARSQLKYSTVSLVRVQILRTRKR